MGDRHHLRLIKESTLRYLVGCEAQPGEPGSAQQPDRTWCKTPHTLTESGFCAGIPGFWGWNDGMAKGESQAARMNSAKLPSNSFVWKPRSIPGFCPVPREIREAWSA